MKNNLTSLAVAHLAISSAIEMSNYSGDMGWNLNDRSYATGCTPGEPGHGRPSVTRKKKAKTHGKNKKRK